MRIGFIGCVDFSHAMLATLIEQVGVEIVGVATKAKSTFNADFCDLTELAAAHGIPAIYQGGGEQQALGEWFETKNPDIIFCIGWPNLLHQSVFHAARLGVFGYHPADLPKNRGRHPIIWALVLGLQETASTFFRIDGGVDSGPIVSKEMVSISPDEDAATLYARLLALAKRQAIDIVARARTGDLRGVEQNLADGNVWRKRSKIDGRIDWRMSADAIHNLVRGITRPYPGAYCEIRDANGAREASIWRVRPVACDAPNLEPGKILRVEGGVIRVKAGEGAIELLEHEIAPLPAEGDYL